MTPKAKELENDEDEVDDKEYCKESAFVKKPSLR